MCIIKYAFTACASAYTTMQTVAFFLIQNTTRDNIARRYVIKTIIQFPQFLTSFGGRYIHDRRIQKGR